MPEPTPLTGGIAASGGVAGTVTTAPFRARLIEACEAAFQRLEAKAGPEHNIFAEVGEVLWWLYAISNFGVNQATIADALRWAHDNYGHGNLLRELHYADYGHVRVGEPEIAAPVVHRWAAVASVREDGSPDWSPNRLDAYNRDLAGEPVIATLRAEFHRLTARTQA